MGMFVRENQRVYFLGRKSSSPVTDEYPYPLLFAFLCAFAPLRESQTRPLCDFDQNIVSTLSKADSVSR
jgi:hypothetical protein